MTKCFVILVLLLNLANVSACDDLMCITRCKLMDSKPPTRDWSTQDKR